MPHTAASRSFSVNIHTKSLPLYVCTWFVSDLALAKFEAVGKTSAPSRQTLQLNCTGCTGHILHGQVAIITKPSPPFLVCDVIMVPGLLPSFSKAARDWPGNEYNSSWQYIIMTNSKPHFSQRVPYGRIIEVLPYIINC